MAKPKVVKTPTLDKMLSVKDQSQAAGQFLDWLVSEKGFVLAKYHEHNDEHCGEYERGNRRECGLAEETLYQEHHSIEKLLAEFFGINLNQAEKERVAILKSLQKTA